ncbi:MAG: DUF3365 domain-containing protein [Magnetococcales bacterium]|nr:DUF3365 domain-containing protein [Magnetococcales bacterium]
MLKLIYRTWLAENTLFRLSFWVVLSGMGITLATAVSLYYSIENATEQTMILAANTARTHYSKDFALRLWASRHGGVYVPVDERTPPNPNLAHMPERDISTPSGKQLTLMNPAYLLRQVMEEYSDLYGARGKLTSLQPLNPANAPDPWEEKVLRQFENGVKEAVEVVGEGEDAVLRLMRPMLVQESCLKCHAFQGYQVGDVRGALGVQVPLRSFLESETIVLRNVKIAHAFFLGCGIVLLGFYYRSVRTYINQERKHREQLEQRVEQRTYELRENEKRLQETTSTLHEIIDRAPFGIVVANGERMIRVFNPASERLFGYQKEEVLGRSFFDLMSPRFRELNGDQFLSYIQDGTNQTKGSISFESTALRNGGTEFPIRIAVNNMILENNFAVIGMIDDISEEKRLLNNLLQSEKMAGLGAMVVGVAHEINTPVGIGVTAVSELKERSEAFESLLHAEGISEAELIDHLSSSRRLITLIQTNLDRAAELVRSFKSVAVDQSNEERRNFKVRNSMESAVRFLQHELKLSKLTVEMVCEEDLEIYSYPGAFSQMVINLISNSIAHAFDPDEAGQVTIALRVAGDRLQFTYRDNGKGMTEEICTRIFEPFFTTRRDLGGSGLGMHIVYNLATQTLGGVISCESTPGAGMSVHIDMPMMRG